MARLEKLRGRLHGFERDDQPAFTGWIAREFGPLLSQAREIETQIRDKQMLLHEVEDEMRRSFCDPQTAYRRVIQQRANSVAGNGASEVPPHLAGNGAAAFGVHLNDVEKEVIFDNFLREYFGLNPEQMDETAYDSTFGAFRFHIFGDTPGEPPFDPTAQSREVEVPSARMKEMYRVLVRRLHPDIRADGDAGACALWHEVQQAYAARNVARLETLLALSDIESGNLGAQTTLYQMRAVWTELKEALNVLRRSLRASLHDEAWGFARRGADAALRIRVEQNLELDLARKARTLDYLINTIAAWSTPPHCSEHRRVDTEQPQPVS